MTFIGGDVATGPGSTSTPSTEAVTLTLPVGAAEDDIAVIFTGKLAGPTTMTALAAWTELGRMSTIACWAWGKVLDAADIAAGTIVLSQGTGTNTYFAALAVVRGYMLSGAVVAQTTGGFSAASGLALEGATEPYVVLYAARATQAVSGSGLTMTPDAAVTVADEAYQTWPTGSREVLANLAYQEQDVAGDMPAIAYTLAEPFVSTSVGAVVLLPPGGAYIVTPVDADITGGAVVELEASGGFVGAGTVDVDGGGDVVTLSYATSWPAATPEAAEVDEPDAGEVVLQQYAETYEHPELIDGIPVDGWGPDWEADEPEPEPTAARVAQVCALALIPYVADEEPEEPETPWLPFDMPARETLTTGAAGERKTLAHYFTQFPPRIQDKAWNDAGNYEQSFWLPPGGVEREDDPETPLVDETIDHRTYGGWTRDIFMIEDEPARPRGAGFRLMDMTDEVEAAKAAGLDGFTVDLLASSLSTSQHWTNFTTLVQAAENVGDFLVVPMPDGNASFTDDVTQMVEDLLTVADSPAMWRIDGTLVIAPYGPEGAGDDAAEVLDFWTDAKAGMAAEGQPFHLWCCYTASWNSAPAKTAPVLDPIAYGHGRWGARHYLGTENDTTWIDECRTDYPGKGVMHYAAPQDTRPRSAKFWEARGTRAFRGAWMVAINDEADIVQVPTWNDLSESAQVMPSKNSGYCWLDLLSYYIVWFKLGAAPTIVRDTVYLTHRVHHTTVSDFTSPHQTLFQVRDTDTEETDFVEALCFLTDAATIELTVCGTVTTVDVGAGLQAVEAALPPGVSGEVSARVIRDEVTVDGTEVVSPYAVTDEPEVQDLQYRISSSRRTPPPQS